MCSNKVGLRSVIGFSDQRFDWFFVVTCEELPSFPCEDCAPGFLVPVLSFLARLNVFPALGFLQVSSPA